MHVARRDSSFDDGGGGPPEKASQSTREVDGLRWIRGAPPKHVQRHAHVHAYMRACEHACRYTPITPTGSDGATKALQETPSSSVLRLVAATEFAAAYLFWPARRLLAPRAPRPPPRSTSHSTLRSDVATAGDGAVG